MDGFTGVVGGRRDGSTEEDAEEEEREGPTVGAATITIGWTVAAGLVVTV